MAFLAAIPGILAAAAPAVAAGSVAAGSAYSIYAQKRALDQRKTATGTYVSSSLTPEESKFQTLQLELARLQSAVGEVAQTQEQEAAGASQIPLPAIGLGVLAVIAFFVLRKK